MSKILKIEFENFFLEKKKKCFAGRIMKITIKRKFCKRNRALKKSDDEKVMCLSYCSLMNCTILFGEVKKGSIFRHKSFNVLFRRVK